MPDPEVIRMVPRLNDPGLARKMTTAEMDRLKGPFWLEGVDGDEEANTVTYWYTRQDPND